MVNTTSGQEEIRAHVAVVVNILGVAADRDGCSRADAAIDSVNGSEGIDVNLQVGQCFVRAWLERGSVATGSDIPSVNGGENSVGVLAGSPPTSVRSDVPGTRVPI